MVASLLATLDSISSISEAIFSSSGSTIPVAMSKMGTKFISRQMRPHSSTTLPLKLPSDSSIDFFIWLRFLMLFFPAIANWKVKAFTMIAIAILAVWKFSGWCNFSAISSRLFFGHSFMYFVAAASTPLMRCFIPVLIFFSEREACSMNVARSSSFPLIHPFSG